MNILGIKIRKRERQREREGRERVWRAKRKKGITRGDNLIDSTGRLSSTCNNRGSRKSYLKVRFQQTESSEFNYGSNFLLSKLDNVICLSRLFFFVIKPIIDHLNLRLRQITSTYKLVLTKSQT